MVGGHSPIPQSQTSLSYVSFAKLELYLRLLYQGLFDSEVQHAIYSDPTWESDEEYRQGAEFQRPDRLHPTLKTKLILSKYHSKDATKRPLCLAITSAVTHLEDEFGQKGTGLRLEFIQALARAAALNMRLSHIVDCISTTPEKELTRLQWHRRPLGRRPRRPIAIDYLARESKLFRDVPAQGAFIAAVYTNRLELANQILESGVKIMERSPAFGTPLGAAAAVGALEFIRTVLQVPKYNPEGLGNGFTRLIKQPIKNGHENVALLLLLHRIPITLRNDKTRTMSHREYRERRFWAYLKSIAERHDCEKIVELAS